MPEKKVDEILGEIRKRYFLLPKARNSYKCKREHRIYFNSRIIFVNLPTISITCLKRKTEKSKKEISGENQGI